MRCFVLFLWKRELIPTKLFIVPEMRFYYICYLSIKIRISLSRPIFLADCQLLFTDETANQRLTFFPTDSIREKDVNVPANQTCSFFYGSQFHVQYLDCTGSWRSITSQLQNVLDTIELTPGWSTSHLRIRVSLHNWNRNEARDAWGLYACKGVVDEVV